MIVRKEEGVSFSVQLGFDFKCKKNADMTYYSQVYTLITNKIDFNAKVSIMKLFDNLIYFLYIKLQIELTENITVKLEIDDFTFNV